MLVPALILVVKYALVAALVGVITFLFYQLAKPSTLKKDSAELPAEQAHKLIRQGYARSKLPEKLDAIVIGSGIGGLMPAVFLAKAGWKVLVLEQHDVLGGTTHTFEEGGYHFDSGVHYVGGDVGVKGSQLNRLFSLLTDGRLEWADICNNDKQCYDNLVVDREKFSFPMRKGEDNLRGDLYKRFPEQKDHDAIDRYFALVKRLELEAGAYFSPRVMPTLLARLVQMLPWYKHYAEHMTRSFDDVMDGITDNRELRAVLCYLYGDYGLPPSRAPFALHAMVATHYFTGAYYPSGGCNKIAEYATQIIEKHGGKAFVRSPVGSLLVDDAGRVTGVRLERNGDEIQAPVVISACGAYNTFAKLLPEERRSVVQQPIEEMKKLSAPTTHLNLFVGLDQTASQLKLPSYNTWNIPTFEVNKVNDEWIDCKTLEDVFKPRADGSAPGIPCFIGFPAAKDPRRAEEKACAEVICEARYSWFEQWKDRPVKHRGQDYEQWKQKLTDALLERLYALYPQTRGHVVFSSLGTPLTNEYYLGSEGGGSYGLAHVIDRWKIDWLRPETPFPGLYLSGQDVCSCGLAGAMMGGFMCTMAVSKAAFFGSLHNLK